MRCRSVAWSTGMPIARAVTGFFCLSSRRRHTRSKRDWSSDVCSSDLKGSTQDYYHPDNAYMHRVLDRRSGLPITLALIVLFIARRLDLPFRGMGMPVHFMLMYETEQEKLFIDPFDHGKIVSYDQCYYFLKQNGIEPKSDHFQA